MKPRSGSGRTRAQLFNDGARAGGAARVMNCHRTVNSDGGAGRTGERVGAAARRSSASSNAQQSGTWHSAGAATLRWSAESLYNASSIVGQASSVQPSVADVFPSAQCSSKTPTASSLQCSVAGSHKARRAKSRKRPKRITRRKGRERRRKSRRGMIVHRPLFVGHSGRARAIFAMNKEQGLRGEGTPPPAIPAISRRRFRRGTRSRRIAARDP